MSHTHPLLGPPLSPPLHDEIVYGAAGRKTEVPLEAAGAGLKS